MKVSVSLIHNGGPRFESAAHTVRAIIEELSILGIETIGPHWVNDQPAIKPMNRFSSSILVLQRFALKRSYRKYHGLSTPRINLASLRSLLIQVIDKGLRLKKVELEKLTISSKISEKHVAAWQFAVNSGADYGFFFEDDAVLGKDYKEILSNAMKAVGKLQPDYIDVAGGFPIAKVVPPNNRHSSSEYFRSGLAFDVIATNTACSYMVRSSTLQSFLFLKEKSPFLRLVAIDDLINALAAARATKRPCSCLWIFPHPIEHGSFTGQFKSWTMD